MKTVVKPTSTPLHHASSTTASNLPTCYLQNYVVVALYIKGIKLNKQIGLNKIIHKEQKQLHGKKLHYIKTLTLWKPKKEPKNALGHNAKLAKVNTIMIVKLQQ